jgi:two-component system sensor histidine kinase KdpD
VFVLVAFVDFFIPPFFSYSLSDLRYLVSFAVFLVVATLTAGLASSLQRQTREAQRRERITASLYGLSRQIAMVQNLHDVGQAIVHHVGQTFGVPVAMVLPDAEGRLVETSQTDSPPLGRPLNPSVLQWVYRHGTAVGYGGKHRPELLYMPLKTEDTVHGVLCLGEYGLDQPFSPEQRQIIESLCGLAAVSVARVTYETQARIAALTAESERLRTALLDSLSHELRTPVTAIMGAIGSLSDDQIPLSTEDQGELVSTIRDSVMRMNRLITNLLGMVRLESGLLRLNRRPCDVSDMIGVVVHQMRETLGSRPLSISVPDNLPPLVVDEVLLEQALVNVLSNAVKYSPNHSPIHISAIASHCSLRIEIRDFGMGIDREDKEKIFEKFYRSAKAQNVPGTGLGLAICQGIAQAHGGRVTATPASPQGTIFALELPWNPPPYEGEAP